MQIANNGDKLFATLELPRSALADAEETAARIRGGQRTTVQFRRARRSLDANAYCWALCHEIGVRLHLGKEDVYRQAVRAAGGFTTVSVAPAAAARFAEVWGMRGIGWVVDELGRDADGNALLAAYHGSSTYDSREMARLIDHLADEAGRLGVPLRPAKDIERMIDRWAQRGDKEEQEDG